MCESRLCEHGSSDLTYSAVWSRLVSAVMWRVRTPDADGRCPTDDRTRDGRLRCEDTRTARPIDATAEVCVGASSPQ